MLYSFQYCKQDVIFQYEYTKKQTSKLTVFMKWQLRVAWSGLSPSFFSVSPNHCVFSEALWLNSHTPSLFVLSDCLGRYFMFNFWNMPFLEGSTISVCSTHTHPPHPTLHLQFQDCVEIRQLS